MTRALIAGMIIALSACSQVDPIPQHTPTAPPLAINPPTVPSSGTQKINPPITPPTAPPKVIPKQEILSPSYQQITRNGITLSMVAYDDRKMQLRVADQPNGLGSRWLTAKDAAATYGGLAAINGGFFTPEGKPLGMLIETGTKRGSINRSSLGAGMFVSSGRRSSIMRREAYSRNRPSAYNLLQAGPMLAENGRSISGLSRNNQRPRSFIAWDGNSHWLIGHASACSLHELSNALAGQSLADFNIKTAINLDGGRSSDLWVSSRISGDGKTHRGFLNKPVRNYLVLIKR